MTDMARRMESREQFLITWMYGEAEGIRIAPYARKKQSWLLTIGSLRMLSAEPTAHATRIETKTHVQDQNQTFI